MDVFGQTMIVDIASSCPQMIRLLHNLEDYFESLDQRSKQSLDMVECAKRTG